MTKPIRLYLLAHPDDEVMSLYYLRDHRFSHQILFLTHDYKSIRLIEAQKIASFLNRNGFDIQIVHSELFYIDGEIHNLCLSEHFSTLQKIVRKINPSEIITTSYEGGHQDHDSIAVLGFLLGQKLSIPFSTFNTYAKSKTRFLPYRVMSPFGPNNYSGRERLFLTFIAARMMLIYVSQWRTWLGLSLFILLRYATGGFNAQTQVNRIEIEPPTGYLYEKRNRAMANEVVKRHRIWINEY